MKEELARWTDGVRAEVVDALRGLVRSGQEDLAKDTGSCRTFRSTQVIIQQLSQAMGLRVVSWPVDDPRDVVSGLHPDGSRAACLMATADSQSPGPAYLLAAHCDVVDIFAPERWTRPPFSGEVNEGVLYGRGSADAKGPLVSCLYGIALAARLRWIKRGSVNLVVVPDEETKGEGIQTTTRLGISWAGALFAEPTMLQLCPACRGGVLFSIKVEGRSAHPGAVWEGVNAIEKAAYIVTRLSALPAEIDKLGFHPLWLSLPQRHTLRISGIQARSTGRSVPDWAEIQCSLSILPGDDFDAIRTVAEEFIVSISTADPWLRDHPPEVVWGTPKPPSSTRADDDFVVSTLRALNEAGWETRLLPFNAASDMTPYVISGGSPAVVFGPGRLEAGHSPNESIEIDQVLTAIQMVATMIRAWCG